MKYRYLYLHDIWKTNTDQIFLSLLHHSKLIGKTEGHHRISSKGFRDVSLSFQTYSEFGT